MQGKKSIIIVKYDTPILYSAKYRMTFREKYESHLLTYRVGVSTFQSQIIVFCIGNNDNRTERKCNDNKITGRGVYVF